MQHSFSCDISSVKLPKWESVETAVKQKMSLFLQVSFIVASVNLPEILLTNTTCEWNTVERENKTLFKSTKTNLSFKHVARGEEGRSWTYKWLTTKVLDEKKRFPLEFLTRFS